jgi:hypothetical protein
VGKDAVLEEDQTEDPVKAELEKQEELVESLRNRREKLKADLGQLQDTSIRLLGKDPGNIVREVEAQHAEVERIKHKLVETAVELEAEESKAELLEVRMLEEERRKENALEERKRALIREAKDRVEAEVSKIVAQSQEAAKRIDAAFAEFDKVVAEVRGPGEYPSYWLARTIQWNNASQNPLARIMSLRINWGPFEAI